MSEFVLFGDVKNPFSDSVYGVPIAAAAQEPQIAAAALEVEPKIAAPAQEP